MRPAIRLYQHMRPILPQQPKPEWALRCSHVRACPEHLEPLDDDGRCPAGHEPSAWLVVRVSPGSEPVVVGTSRAVVPLGPRIPGRRMRARKGGKPSRKAQYLATRSWQLRKRGVSHEEARAEAERRWAARCARLAA